MRVKVSARCEIRPDPRTIVVYKPGDQTTKRAWGAMLVEQGKAVEIVTPRRRNLAEPK